jgi:hypothetical protein
MVQSKGREKENTDGDFSRTKSVISIGFPRFGSYLIDYSFKCRSLSIYLFLFLFFFEEKRIWDLKVEYRTRNSASNGNSGHNRTDTDVTDLVLEKSPSVFSFSLPLLCTISHSAVPLHICPSLLLSIVLTYTKCVTPFDVQTSSDSQCPY